MKEPCSPGATVRIAILGLHVHGQLATLELGFTPDEPSQSATQPISLFTMPCGSNPDVSLLDPINLKRYVVVQDSQGSPLATSEALIQAANGQTATGNWMFAAPPAATVTSVDVQVGQWPTFNNVPVQR